MVEPATPATSPSPQRDVLAEQAAAYAAKLEAALAKRQAAAEAAAADAQAEAATEAATKPAEPAPAVIEEPAEITVPPAGSDAPRAAQGKRPRATGNLADDGTTAPRAVPASDDLHRGLAQRMRDYPRDVSVHLDYQLLQLVRDEKVPAMSEIANLQAEDRELLAALLDALSNFRASVRRDNNMLQSAKVRPLVEMGTRLRAQSELTIPTIALCKKVKGFGVYEPVEPEFSAGREQQVIVYCEVENFASQLNEQQQWETKLKQDVVLYTETGLPVWQAKTHTVTDVSRNRRHDFFAVEIVTLPGNLTIGRYLLKVTVVDQHANRIAEATLPVKIVARAGGGQGSQPNTAPVSPAAAALEQLTK